MSSVGIIANPASGKDIRRLVAFGSVFDNEEKVRIIRRVILGLSAMNVDEVLYMPDAYGIVDRAMAGLEKKIPVRAVLAGITAGPADSVEAARIMAEKKTGCIITLGGDGTNRAAAKGTLNVPILPISTGTNNVFPAMVEGTLAGLAAGIVAKKEVSLAESTFVSTLLEVIADDRVVDLALVDAVVYDDLFVGARAVWDMQKVRWIYLNRAAPDSIGLSAIGGLIQPVSARAAKGLILETGNSGMPVSAPVAPGLIRRLFIRHKQMMKPGKVYPIPPAGAILALDGERELMIRKERPLALRLSTAGPRVVDVGKTMAAAVKKKVFVRERGNTIPLVS